MVDGHTWNTLEITFVSHDVPPSGFCSSDCELSRGSLAMQYLDQLVH